MVDIDEAIKSKQVLWMVWGGTVVYIDCVMIKDSNSRWGPCVWGYSVYRRSPGFRTIGRGLHVMQGCHTTVEFFGTLNEAIQFFESNGGQALPSPEELKAKLTPSLKFLKKNSYTHNLSVEL